MTIYLVVPLLLVIGVLQTAIVPHLAIWGVFADLPLLVVVGWSLLRGAREGIVWGFIAGLMVDLFSGAPFGAATLPMLVVGLLSGLGEAAVFRTHGLLLLVTAFLATILYDLLFMLVVQISGQAVAWLGSFFRIVLPSAVLNAMLVPLVFGLMRWLYIWLGRRETEL